MIRIPWLTPAGGDNNLAVVLGTYERPISCREMATSVKSCRDILYSMRADRSPQVFGPGSDPAVTKVLPFSINSGQCTAKPSPKKPILLTSIFS